MTLTSLPDYFSIVYFGAEVVYICFRLCDRNIPDGRLIPLHLESKSAMARVSTPQKSADATKQGCLFPEEPIVKYLSAHFG